VEDGFFEFFWEHIWVPIVGVLGWLLRDWKKGIDMQLLTLNRKFEKQNNYINDKFVKKDELHELLKEVRYVRERVDEIADRVPRNK